MTAGVPSVFVRLSLCNLRCGWCDTKYTWDWEHYDPKGEIVLSDVASVVQRVARAGPRNVVITGGEPLLQQRELEPMVAALKAIGHRIEVETNGTIAPKERLAGLVDQWNVSPKLRNSGNDLDKREVPAALAWFAAAPRAYGGRARRPRGGGCPRRPIRRTYRASAADARGQ